MVEDPRKLNPFRPKKTENKQKKQKKKQKHKNKNKNLPESIMKLI